MQYGLKTLKKAINSMYVIACCLPTNVFGSESKDAYYNMDKNLYGLTNRSKQYGMGLKRSPFWALLVLYFMEDSGDQAETTEGERAHPKYKVGGNRSWKIHVCDFFCN